MKLIPMVLALSFFGSAMASDCVKAGDGIESCRSVHSGGVVTTYMRVKMQWGWFIPSDSIATDNAD